MQDNSLTIIIVINLGIYGLIISQPIWENLYLIELSEMFYDVYCNLYGLFIWYRLCNRWLKIKNLHAHNY